MADEQIDTTETQNSEPTPETTSDATDTSILGDVGTGENVDDDPAKEVDKPENAEAGAPAYHGDAPEAYQFKAPEGRTLDPEATALFDPVFKTLGLTNDGAQVLVDAAPAFIDHVAAGVQADINAQVAATRKGWADEAVADPEIGGSHFEETKAICAKMFDKFGWAEGGGFRTFLNESGLGNHPELIRAMVKIAKVTGEDSFDRGESAKGEVPIWDRIYSKPTTA